MIVAIIYITVVIKHMFVVTSFIFFSLGVVGLSYWIDSYVSVS